MNNIENALVDEIPNLDAFVSPDEAAQMEKTFKELAPVFINLGSYCEAKKHAMQCRLDGKIELARKFESACDVVYKRLPDWAKW